MNAPDPIIPALSLLRSHVTNAPGHDHLYGEFDGVVGDLVRHRDAGGEMTLSLAREIRATVDLLVGENMAGRRPWSEGNWEVYFSKCLEDAHRLLKEAVLFRQFQTFCPPGYCNGFLAAFEHMDRHDREYEEQYPRWSRHFAHLASLAAEMFSLVADPHARVEPTFLENPDDRVFTFLLSGYAKSKAPEAARVLKECLDDDEAWVRRLAGKLIGERTLAQQPAAADGEDAAAAP